MFSTVFAVILMTCCSHDTNGKMLSLSLSLTSSEQEWHTVCAKYATISSFHAIHFRWCAYIAVYAFECETQAPKLKNTTPSKCSYKYTDSVFFVPSLYSLPVLNTFRLLGSFIVLCCVCVFFSVSLVVAFQCFYPSPHCA